MAPELHQDQYAMGLSADPQNGIGAVVDDRSDTEAALRALRDAGYYGGSVSVFIGQEGLNRLDLKGEAHGVVGRVKHAVESLFTEERKFHDAIESALQQGKCYLTVQTDGGEEQKNAVQSLLKAHHAHEIRFFGTWATEHL
jgi:hypothetical protein